jgi:hypothetical protein
MNKVAMMGLAAALTGVLAGCGSTVSVGLDFGTPGSTVSTSAVALYNLKSEYVDQNGRYVACDNVFSNGSSSQRSAVGVYFQLGGDVSQVTVGLRGSTTSQYDGNYNQTFSRDQIVNANGTGTYKAVFYADAKVAPLPQSIRPQAIVVTPTDTVTIKRVSVVSSDLLGSFYATINATNQYGTFTDSSNRYTAQNARINLYSSCTLTGETAGTL